MNIEEPRNEGEGILEGVRVLDLSNELGFLCGKILGDLGADVIKVEPPGGDPARHIGPFFGDVPDPEKSLYWFAYNNNKRGITLDIKTETGKTLFKQLAGKAEILIETHPPGELETWGLDYGVLSQINRGLVVTSITPFGQKGPYRHWRASDLELMAMSGFMSLLGTPDRPPVRCSLPQSYMWTGMHAAMGTLMAYYRKRLTGKGQFVDVSGQASILWAMAHGPTFWDLNRETPERHGEFVTGRSITGAKMRAIFPCKDGYVNFIIYGGPAGIHTNQAMFKWMEEEGMGEEVLTEKDWKTFKIETVTQEEIDRIEKPIAAFLRTKTRQEFREGAIRRGMLGYAVSTAKDILDDSQLKARGFWQEIDHDNLGMKTLYPGAFARFSGSRCSVRRRAPLIGEHNTEVFGAWLGIGKADLVKLKLENVV
jgi:crotonobetainyl-CoA:carnitine CoA-transferase CaiB-like acyl-CoA transferase